MLQSSLTYSAEHQAWRQRVNKEIGTTQKFYQTLEMNQAAFNQTNMSGNSVTATSIRPFNKTNVNQNLLKKGNFYMIDSTYLVASNPNTMRDNGPCRNAEYYVQLDPSQEDADGYNNTLRSQFEWSDPQKNRMGYVKGKGNKKIQNLIDYPNKDVYSFGGKTKMGASYHHKNAYTGLIEPDSGFYRTTNKWTQSVDDGELIDKELHEKVNDYTKNISQPIFSPGMVPTGRSHASKTAGGYRKRLSKARRSIGYSKKPFNMKQFKPLRTNAVVRKPDVMKQDKRPSSVGRSFRSVKTLSRMHQRERRKRMQMQSDIENVKETLSHLYEKAMSTQGSKR